MPREIGTEAFACVFVSDLGSIGINGYAIIDGCDGLCACRYAYVNSGAVLHESVVKNFILRIGNELLNLHTHYRGQLLRRVYVDVEADG